MTVDLDAIARRGRCNVSNLRAALPLLEQGYTPPFLARYRRDELGGIDEASLWALAHALDAEQRTSNRREELHSAWEATALQDPAIGHAIRKAHSKRMLDRLALRLKLEKSSQVDDASRLAVRLLNPRKGDGDDVAAVAKSTENIQDADEAVAKVDQALAQRLSGDPRIIGAAVRWLAKNAKIYVASVSDPHGGEDSSAQAKAKAPTVANGGAEAQTEKSPAKAATQDSRKSPQEQSNQDQSNQDQSTQDQSNQDADPDTGSDTVAQRMDGGTKAAEPQSEPLSSATADAAPAATSGQTDSSPDGATASGNGGEPQQLADPKQQAPAANEGTGAAAPADPGQHSTAPAGSAGEPGDSAGEPGVSVGKALDTNAASSPEGSLVSQGSQENAAAASDAGARPDSAADGVNTATTPPGDGETKAANGTAAAAAGTPTDTKAGAESTTGAASDAATAKSDTPPKPAKKKQKKISPRQRRRKWLVSVLKPLAGKRISAGKLSSFQLVMLGRALRSQVVECLFEYDAKQLVDELQRTAVGINRNLEQKLRDTVMLHEANIREAAEAAWWDELQEQSSTRLVSVAADNLSSQVNRGNVEARVVMSIDAVGPRTAATSIVATNGQLLHTEDIPCQLSAALRAQAVAKMGELIHRFNVDLIVISNGPARRACMVAVKELIGQSPDSTLRWTLADRSGADAYAGGSVGDQEMRSTPRRFRAASWIAFSVLQPAQALAKVDPLKLRLGSFQRELSDDALVSALEDVVVSGASRGGVDVNTATTTWLAHLPGVNEKAAQSLEEKRSGGAFQSRADIEQLPIWNSAVESRQAIPFLRVFGSEETLDGTLIHPEDYGLAKKLATTLEIELPPPLPPGYQRPDAESQAATEDVETAEASTATTSGPEESASSSASPQDSDAPAESDAPAASDAAAASETGEAANDSDRTSPDDDTPAGEATATAATSETEPEPSSAAAEGEAETNSADNSEVPASSEAQSSTDALPGFSAPDGDAPSETPPAAAEPKVVPVNLPEPIRRPRPERAKVDKCVKEWQIGPHRAHQLVDWLCDPFGDSDFNGNSPAVLTTMPTLSSLTPGDQVIGVVVGVMPFGVFLELAPDCSGLIHVSRLAENFVEDVHEAVQVGDVITAWVTGTDPKRRRVALSGVSPAREEEIAKEKSQRDSSRGPRGGRGGGSKTQGAPRGGGRGRTGQPRDSQPAGKRGGGRPDRQRSGQKDSRGGRARDRGHGARRGGAKKPDSYRVASSKPAEPISEAMKKGEEPLRSFGDLMQFFSSSDSAEKTPPPPQSKKQPAAGEPTVKQESQQRPEDKPSGQDPTADSEAKPPVPPGATEQTPSPPPQAATPEATSGRDDDAEAKPVVSENNEKTGPPS